MRRRPVRAPRPVRAGIGVGGAVGASPRSGSAGDAPVAVDALGVPGRGREKLVRRHAGRVRVLELRRLGERDGEAVYLLAFAACEAPAPPN